MKKLMKLQLLVIAFVLLIAGSAFASLTYDVSVDTSGLTGTGYLYLQYNTAINQAGYSTATVSNFTTDGVLGSTAAGAFDNSGTHVSGTLPSVSFTNGYVETNDYNQAITFGSNLKFSLLMPTGTAQNAGSTFSLGLYQDAYGLTALKTVNGTLFTISTNADGTATTLVADSGTGVTATPIPAAAWLLGSGLMGLVGIRRKLQN